MSNLPIILIEVVLIFGGVLAFGFWQLHSLKQSSKNDEKKPGGDQ